MASDDAQKRKRAKKGSGTFMFSEKSNGSFSTACCDKDGFGDGMNAPEGEVAFLHKFVVRKLHSAGS